MEAMPLGGTLRLSAEHDQSASAPIAELPKWNLNDRFREFAQEYVKRLTEAV